MKTVQEWKTEFVKRFAASEVDMDQLILDIQTDAAQVTSLAAVAKALNESRFRDCRWNLCLRINEHLMRAHSHLCLFNHGRFVDVGMLRDGLGPRTLAE